MLQGLKSLFVAAVCPADEETPASSSLPYALSLAASAEAHLSAQVAAVRVVLPSASSSATVAGLVATENRRLAALATDLAAELRADAAAAGVPCATDAPHLPYQDLVHAMLLQTRVHDLSLFDGGLDSFEAARGLTEAALFQSGRPVLVIPQGCETFACKRIVIAWDGSIMASRAVAGAMPFLRAAHEVEIVSVIGEKDLSRSVAGAELAVPLGHHGISVTVKDLPVGPGGVAETFRDQAHLFHADMIVMGAYKHARLREWILGGVTQSLLSESPTPLLMSH